MSNGDQRWLVTGASGQLGGHILCQLAERRPVPAILALAGHGEVTATGAEVRRIDLRDAAALRQIALAFRPTHIVHVAALTSVAEARARPADAEQINVHATRVLAQAATACAARLVFSSTDMVFDGTAAPYAERDTPRPLSQYGRTKAAAEAVVASMPGAVIVRLPLLYGWPATSRRTTFTSQIDALRAGTPLRLFTDEFRTPVWVVDAARAMIALACSDYQGLIHVAGPQRLSRYELVAAAARVLGIDHPKLEPVSRESIAAEEPRPADLSLDGRRFCGLFPELAPGAITERTLGGEPSLR
jgi:dTDP-4-dehydrorhamnose reductase